MPRKQNRPEGTIHIDTNRQAAPASEDLLYDRVKKSRKDRVFLSRCIAFVLLGLAVANVVPGVLQIRQQIQSLAYDSIAIWTYWQLFSAFLFIIYAIFLLQVSDWSSLQAISAFALMFAALFGFVAAALLLGGGEGKVATFLELPFSLIERTKIWCIAMLIVLMGASYVAGMEAIAWKKMERLFREISNRKTGEIVVND